MSLNFSIANVVYVKNLSADATENDLRRKFEECDEILGINFKKFPGKNQKYCQIEFRSSEGITKASRLNGELLLNVPMVVTVIEPVLQNQNISQMKSGNEQEHGENDKNKNGNSSETLSSVNNAINAQNNPNVKPVSLKTEEQTKEAHDAQINASAKQNRPYDFSKIVYLENIPENFNASHIDVLFKDVGHVVNKKIQFDEKKRAHAAFVEFETEEEAKNALNFNGLRVGGNEMLIKDAFSLMNGNDALKNNLPFLNNKDENMLNYKPTVSEKVEKVLALKEKLTAKLCAMYKPNILLMNNLIGTPNNPLLTSINMADQNTNANNALMNVSAIVNAIAKAKEEKEKGIERETIIQGITNLPKSTMDNINGKKKETEQDKTKDKVKNKSNKEKHSRDNHNEYETDSSSSYSSSTDKHKKRENKKSRSKTEKKTQRISSTKRSRHHSKNYSYDSSSSSRSRHSSSSNTNSSSISDSTSSSSSSYVSHGRRDRSSRKHSRKHSRRNRYYSRNRCSYERKRRKKGSRHKRFRSSSNDNSNSSYSSSYSSGASCYSERKKSRSNKSKSETPWWVRESQKMEMRQRLKEKRLREGKDYRGSDFLGRNKYRRRR